MGWIRIVVGDRGVSRGGIGMGKVVELGVGRC